MQILTWFGSEYFDSFCPFCTTTVRVLTHAGCDFVNNNFPLPYDQKLFNGLLRNTPMIKEKSKSYRGIFECLEYFKETQKFQQYFPKDEVSIKKNTMLVDWCLGTLSRIVAVTNYGIIHNRRKIDSIWALNATKKLGESPEKAIVLIEENHKLKEKQWNKITHPDELKITLDSVFFFIDGHLQGKEYLVNNAITLSDIMVFSHLLRILIPGFISTEHLINSYPSVIKWMQRIADQTIGEYTVYPKIFS